MNAVSKRVDSRKGRTARERLVPGHIATTASDGTVAILCGACLEARTLFVKPLSASMLFTEAADVFLASRTSPVGTSARYIKKNTYRDYKHKLGRLKVFFGELRLEEIHLGHLASYREMRLRGEGFTRVIGNKIGAAPVPSPAGPTKAEAELRVLIRILKRAKVWDEEMGENDAKLQPEDSDIDRALSPDQQAYFLTVAGSRPEWEVIQWYAIVALHTTFSSDEMRTIRIGDVNLNPTVMSVSVNYKYGKNKFRRRAVAICDDDCAWAFERLIERAKGLTGGQFGHYLFPGRVVRNQFDGSRPMCETGLRKQFEAVRAAAGFPWFKFNGFRHTGISRLAEAGHPIAVIMARSGHVTEKMSRHYTHISEQAQRAMFKPSSQSRRKPPQSAQYGQPGYQPHHSVA